MRILGIKAITGPNVFSHKPVLVMTLDLQNLAGKESFEIPGFVDRLIALMPGLEEHYCGLGRRGGFIERLRTGTYFGHIVEHVALELTDAVEIPVNRGKTVESGKPGVYLVAVEYKSEAGMRRLLQAAVDAVDALVRGEEYDFAPAIEEARAIKDDSELGPSTRAIIDAAERRGIPWMRADDQSLVRLGYGIHRKYVESTIAHTTRVIGVDIAGDKELTKTLLDRAAIPVPRGVVVESADEAAHAFKSVGGPVVIKPLDGNQGKGVSLNLTSEAQVREAFEIAQGFSKNIILERMLRGRDYRLVVVDGKLVAASERVPAHVWGDGQHTIQELIDHENEDPSRGTNHEKPLTKIQVDPVAVALLKKHGRTLDDVPREGELILLRESANLSTGGSARDVTDEVHPGIRRVAERAARAIGLDVCGIDFVVEDISRPLNPQRGGIVEINAAPGIRMHHFPTQGTPRDVGGAIVDMMYPNGLTGRIPIVSVTGTNGKTTTSRMIAHALTRTGLRTGLTTTEGIYIDGEEIARGDMTGPWSAGVILGDDTVEAAVLETARGGIFRSGLGYDWSEVGVITNIQLDHIGQDGIETIDDIVWIKRLVAERVREGGVLVLNADDPHLTALAQAERTLRVPKRIVYFSLDAENEVVREHVRNGGAAYVLRDGWIEERTRERQVRIVDARSMPSTMQGRARFQTANALAATAAARALDVGIPEIADALMEFRNDRDNPGRMNLFSVQGRSVLIDYGHNPAALQGICDVVRTWPTGRAIAVFGLPGDRSDDLLRDSAKVLGCGFQEVILREDQDLRGRQPGELPHMLQEVIRSTHPNLPTEIVPDEIEALDRALERSSKSDLLVLLCEKPDRAIAHLHSLGAIADDGAEAWSAAGLLSER